MGCRVHCTMYKVSRKRLRNYGRHWTIKIKPNMLPLKRIALSESFQVAAIIKKLPFAENEFNNYIKHKRKEMSVEDLIVRLQIEEENRDTGKKLNKVANVNVTPPYSPQSNGVVERKNQTLKEMMNALLESSRLSQNMWGKQFY
ncbi:glycine-rich RNA-binding protein 10-like [Gossypium australe]|uniref:Glycine-rich RNA-binding protein 10-like n=1 Tax=Gossypium australe TaxID=47621 RepID=A0A5B6VAQ2_9ROSI|nr:glycine-rich RNA-binding protein 10-like [Gossypium australe]